MRGCGVVGMRERELGKEGRGEMGRGEGSRISCLEE